MINMDELKTQYTATLINEIEEIFSGAEVVDCGHAIAVMSLDRILAITPKTEDPHDDIDRLCGFLYHLIHSGGKIFAPICRCGD